MKKLFNILSTCKSGGYLYCRTEPPHPRRNEKGLYYEHRVIMENELGRPLSDGEVVHHIDGDKSNNDVSNLIVLSVSEHAKIHAKKVLPVVFFCAACGKKSSRLARAYRRAVKKNKSGQVFCSISCGAKTGSFRPAKPITHSAHGYWRGCRCAICRKGHLEANRQWRLRQIEKKKCQF